MTTRLTHLTPCYLMSLGLFACAHPAHPAHPDDPGAQLQRERAVRTEQLRFTAGKAEPVSETTFVVRDAVFRADAVPGDAATLEFTYDAPIATAVPLASGELRRQIGLKLRSQDTCNVIYVMWHIAPQSRLEVSVKHNPGMSLHEQCRDSGYSFVTPEVASQAAPIRQGERHTLHVELHGDELRVDTDAKPAWRGRLPPAAAALSGPIGLRTDNAVFHIGLVVADPPSP